MSHLAFQKKIYQSVEQIVKSMNIQSSNSTDAELVLTSLMNSNVEYERLGVDKLKPIVTEALNSYFFQKSSNQSKRPILADSNNLLPYRAGEKRNNDIDEKSHSDSRPKKANKTLKNSNSSSSSSSSSSGVNNPSDNQIKVIHGMIDGMATKSEKFLVDRPTARLSDLAGIKPIMENIGEIIFYPVYFPRFYSDLGVLPPCGLLLNGPSGCGKTHLGLAIAGELGLPFFKVTGPELIGGTSGESEQLIKELFKSALSQAPSVIFLDAIDVIAMRREASQSRGMDRRIIAQLFDCMDEIANSFSQTLNITEPADATTFALIDSQSNPYPPQTESSTEEVTSSHHQQQQQQQQQPKIVILIAATSRPDLLDPGVRGRFAKEIPLPVPDLQARSEILRLLCKNMKTAKDVDFTELGRVTPGTSIVFYLIILIFFFMYLLFLFPFIYN